MTTEQNRYSRPTWRDVLDLQEQIRKDFADHRAESREDHQAIEKRLAALERTEAKREGQSAGEAKILGIGRSGIALIVSLISAAGVVFSIVHG